MVGTKLELNRGSPRAEFENPGIDILYQHLSNPLLVKLLQGSHEI